LKFDWLFEHDQIISPIVGVATATLCFFVVRGFRRRRQLRHVEAVDAGKIPRPLPRFYPWRRGLITGAILSTLYLLVFRGISLAPHYFNDNKGGAILMSFAFLFFGPFMAGCVTIVQGSDKVPWSIKASLIAPWIPILVNLIIAIGVKWEGIICAVFILPPALISASLGGLIIGLFQRYLHNRHTRTTVYCLAALPLFLAMAEAKLVQPLQTRTVETSVVIHAPPSTVWKNIERVPTIARSELRPSWANLIGFPRPVAATLSHEGIGGVRNASFERGLNFTETITQWIPNQRIVFTIKADTAAIPTTTLDEHVTVGGRFFDVLTGEYDLQPLPNGDTLLHLSSRERLSTDFNAYAAMWSDAVMRDMQSNILHVIRNRCEATPISQNSIN
jgi:uncharacterized protein YndB with AHSA1/START domain